MDRSLVVVSKSWHEPFIRVDITEIGIGVTMTLEDFVKALELESGYDLADKAEKVITGMKHETSKVI